TTDESATTTNTPTATPMIVSSARTVFARIDSSASVTPSRARRIRFINDMARSLLTQCFDGIEQRRAPCRIDARDHSDDEPEQRCRNDRPRRDSGWQEWELPGDRFGNSDPQPDADDRAERAEGCRFDEKLPED